MPPLRHDALALALDGLDADQPYRGFRPTSSVKRDTSNRRRYRSQPGSWSKARRNDGQESFKCRHCRAFIGPTVSGGRHRNHCPLCLYSRHVDDHRPGDRASTCGALMTPVGTFHRPKGEQVVLHRCLGCGQERHNRIAADDSPVTLLRLPLVPPRSSKRQAEPDEEAIA